MKITLSNCYICMKIAVKFVKPMNLCIQLSFMKHEKM